MAINKDLNDVAKRIQTRLSKVGVKVALPDIRPVVESMVTDFVNPSSEEVNNVIDYFMNNATQLTVISDDVDGIDTINTVSIQDDKDYPELPAPLATTNKSELVANTAVSLGIQLSTQDIENIADNFDAGSDDFTQTLEQVKGAIIAYVQHKIATNNQKITDTINEISQVASDGFEENSQTLTNGLKQLNQQLVQQSTDFKSRLAGTLSRFKLPAAS